MHCFSYLFHPVFMPLTVFMFIHLGNKFLVYPIQTHLSYFYLILIFTTIVAPLSIIALKKKYGIIDSYEINNHKKRHHALFPALIWNCVCYYLVRGLLYFSVELNIIFITPIVLIFICLIISNFWKISIHMTALGGATGIFYYLSITYNEYFLIFCFFVVISGLVASSRHLKKAHSFTQIYSGYILGALVFFLLINI